ncbi:MAG: SDR family NAD(P)-dependent oxidoreductase [Chloroflexi bacterium]|nr:SDR family NAD(P)-dependent oxidoreductase [Chloroflexota bacterium]
MILDAFKLDGRVAVVTGAAQGLGQALALGLAEAGADVVALDRRACDETLRQIAGLDRRGHGIILDLQGLSPELAQEVIRESVAHLGRLDILINNAGIIRRAAALDFSQEDWESVLNVNLSSVFYLSQAAARYWAAEGRGGKIVNIASMLSFQGGILVSSYTAAKSGVAGLTRALANEWAGLGINVNAIAPGYMATDAADYLHGAILPVDGGWLGR